MPIVIGVLNGQPLNTRLPDDSIVVGGYGRPLERPAEFLVGPDDITLLPIVKVATDPDYLPGTKLEITPASTKMMDATVEVVCPTCKTKQVMAGWVVWSPDWLPNISVQCPNCQTYHWIENLVVRKLTEEFGINRPSVTIVEEA